MHARGHRGGPGCRGAEGLVALVVDQIGDEVAVWRDLEPDHRGHLHGRHDPQRTTASRAAHSTARSDSSEPSVAATRGFTITAGPPSRSECAGKASFASISSATFPGQRAVGHSDRYLAG